MQCSVATSSLFWLRALLLLITLLAVAQCWDSHYVSKSYTVRELHKVKKCYYGKLPKCCWRWVWEWRTVTKINDKACLTGWGSCYCHVPICNSPRCINGNVCIQPNQCYCRNGGTGSCRLNECDTYNKDCFPGTCDGGSNCICVSGHEGANCLTMLDGPIFQSCSVKLVSQGNRDDTLFEQTCGDENFNNFTFYSNERDYNLVMNWVTTHELPDDNSPSPRYILKYAPGIVAAHASVTLRTKDDAYEINQTRAWVNPDLSVGNNFKINDNKDVFFRVNKAMKHLDYLDVQLYAETGGYKSIHDEGRNKVLNKTFTGIELFQQVRVKFDLVPPEHCSSNNNCTGDDWSFPINVEPDITMDKVTILWSRWHDEDSGIGEFSYEIFPMGINQDNQLSEVSTPVASGKWEDDDEEPPTFKPDKTGMYSVILTVTDQAGNAKQARGLFLYDPEGYLAINNNEDLYVSNAEKSTDYQWITSVQNATYGPDIEVSWKNHFMNDFYTDNDLLGEVKPWPDAWADDLDGNRTIAAITTNNGVQNFRCGVIVAAGEEYIREEDVDWMDMGMKDTVTLPAFRSDGAIMRVYVKATDVAQHSVVDYTDVRVDSSAPLLVEETMGFSPNVATLYPLPEFSSTVNLNVVDEVSGLTEITYELFEVSNRQQETKIQSGNQTPQKEKQSSSCQTRGQCYCVSSGTCYRRMQSVYLNNCWFMNRDIKNYRLRFKAHNAAGLSTEGAYDIPAADVSNLKGEGEYPPIPENLLTVSEGKLAAYSATLEWRLPQACYEIDSTLLTYTVTGKPRSENVLGREQKLEGLCSATEYTVSATVLYKDGAKSEPVTVTFTTLEGDSRCAGGLSGGAVAGIIIGVLILLALLAILFFMLWRKYRQKRPLLPRPVTDRFSRFLPDNWHTNHAEPPPYEPNTPVPKGGVAYANNAYSTATGVIAGTDSTYYDESQVAARWKFPSDRVRLGEFLPGNPSAKDPGRFADIRMATLATKSGNRQVVAKMLTSTARDKDREVMKAKMDFFGNRLSFHRNVLNFIGALPDHESGPILLFDYCNKGRLLDWIKKQKTMDEDVEFNMSNFCIMIACGMEFLHEEGIIHKRLGARNILLVEKDGVLQAKITGFGPMREGGRVPARWFAPEQMEADEGPGRVYTKETDVWTYGITIWEIYSKGGKPFQDIAVPDLKRHVTNGYRMERPEYCPEFVYESVMHPCWSFSPYERPSMSAVHGRLREHFEGPGGQTGYYDERELMEEEDELYFDATSMKR